MRKIIYVLGPAFALATALFWGTMLTSPPISNYPRLQQWRLQALTVARIVPKTVAPGVRRAVSTTVRIAASP